MSIKRKIVAVKHNERRNGERCSSYWSICSSRESFNSNSIDGHWFVEDIPSRFKSILNNSEKDFINVGIKRGWFELKLKRNLEFRDYGHVPLEIVIDIKQLPNNYKKNELKEALECGDISEKDYNKILKS